MITGTESWVQTQPGKAETDRIGEELTVEIVPSLHSFSGEGAA